MSQNDDRPADTNSEELRRMVLAASWHRDRALIKSEMRRRHSLHWLMIIAISSALIFCLYYGVTTFFKDRSPALIQQNSGPPAAHVEPPILLRFSDHINSSTVQPHNR